MYKPKACYEMTQAEKDVFLQTLKSIKPPDEYSSNISRCVQLNERKLTGMKSYVCHMLMQEYLPIALRGTLPDHVSTVLIELCDFFRRICLKDLDENDLQFLESRVAVTLCKLEKIFPPSFFTVMVHLVIHLVREVRLGGPIPFHLMYLIERDLCTLKSYVNNKACPEGSILKEKSAAYEIDEKSLTQAHLNWPVTAASKSAFVGVLFSVVPSSRIISCPSASNSGSSSWMYTAPRARKRMICGASSRVETGQFRTLVESWFTEEKQVESERKKINRLKSIEPHVTGTKSFARVKDEETKKNKGVSPSRGGMYCITRTRKDGSIVNAVAAQVVADIKAIGDSSSTDQETTNNSDWTNDDLSKVKRPERRGSVRCTGKFLVKNDKRSHDPQVPLLKAQVKYLRQGFMMFAVAVEEQVPNLNLSSVMNFMNMEVDDLSSIHDNMTRKNPSSASGTSNHQNSHF
ncbi:transposase, Ptta/En/Spm, partial [Tanacetum coccineum]